MWSAISLKTTDCAYFYYAGSEVRIKQHLQGGGGDTAASSQTLDSLHAVLLAEADALNLAVQGHSPHYCSIKVSYLYALAVCFGCMLFLSIFLV